MKKRGLSEIISLLAILVFSFIALGVIWLSISNIFSESLNSLFLDKVLTNLKIKNAKLSGNNLEVEVERVSDKNNLSGIIFLIGDGLNSKSFRKNVNNMDELERKTFTFDLSNSNLMSIKEISVIPVFTKSDKEILGLADKKIYSFLLNYTGYLGYSFKNREHIRIFRNFGSADEIILNRYDLSQGLSEFDEAIIKNASSNHLVLKYDLNLELIPPSNKSTKLKEWYCTEKLNKPLDECNIPDNWLCENINKCDIPEEIFLHFKDDTNITLNLGNAPYYPGVRSGIIKGWDPNNFVDSNNDGYADIDINKDGNISDLEWENRPNKNASSKIKQTSRVPSYYWGGYWEYLTGEIVNFHSNFALNPGNLIYQEFMSESYIPSLFNSDLYADGIFFDSSTKGYWEIWENWGKINGYFEYFNYSDYLNDNANLLKTIKEILPSNKVIVGNTWHNTPPIIDGGEWENWLGISFPYEKFKINLDGAKEEIQQGLITLLQFNPTYDENYSSWGENLPNINRDRDQIYALASYYLVAGNTSYFAYGIHPNNDNGKLFFKAIDFNVGYPVSDYYFFKNELGQGENKLYNGDFEITNFNNKPDGWVLQNQSVVSIAPESECQFNGKCVKIKVNDISNYINSQNVILNPNTTYTLSGYIKSVDVSGSYGANVFPWDFDDLSPLLNECGITLSGSNPWIPFYCTFTTKNDFTGGITFRIMHGSGTAWFDNIELRRGIIRKIFARNYTNSLILVQPRPNEASDYESAIKDNLDGNYYFLLANGSLHGPNTSINLRYGEAAILIKQ